MLPHALCRRALCLATLAAFACVDEPPDALDDGLGDAAGDGTVGDEAADTETEGGALPSPCEAVHRDIAFALEGLESLVDGCASFKLEGQVVAQVVDGGAGSYELDACPCGETCPEADSYILTVDTPELELLPSMEGCVTVIVDPVFESCEPGLLSLFDEVGQPYYFASHLPVASLDQKEVFASIRTTNAQVCGEELVHELEIDNEGEILARVAPGTSERVHVYPNGPWRLHNLSSRDTDVRDFDWVFVYEP
ncbi:hypothetical protein PPSIR1_29388 [Plesiocystis pacifica SIR-1]|uniref:Lipoprotein n=1 Tax=Plesiocystis pacifica SIR-1 TaxID=391625 RepID=A6G645_9BACT|nr:hypothetical protein [Plesiocystis pacifica]EDM78647.1 hypothetical protein PPSIR1_29388 [Plesiocystis pacifica SIR-1]